MPIVVDVMMAKRKISLNGLDYFPLAIVVDFEKRKDKQKRWQQFRMSKFKLLFIALLFTATVHAQTTSAQEQIQKTIENLFTALTNADTIAMKTFATSNVRFYEYGEIWTMDTLIHKVMLTKSISGFKRTNKFEFINTTINKNIAWTTYYLHSAITRNGKDELVKWMETVVLIKDKKQWKVDVLHSTRLPKN
jgi:SnoaL-like domain